LPRQARDKRKESSNEAAALIFLSFITQRPINPDNSASEGALWWLPLTIGDGTGAVDVTSCPSSSASCTVTAPASLLPSGAGGGGGGLVLNPTGTGLYRVEYTGDKTVLFVRF